MRTLRPAPLLLLAAALPAQNYSVSPTAYTNAQGNGTNPIPLQYAAARYQQIHGDLKGTPLVVQGMSLRRGAGAQANATARTIDLTMLCANSKMGLVSPTFASNYVGAPTTTLPKTTLNFPDWTVPGGTPEPWTVVVPFTTPFIYLAVDDLLWEWLVENNSGATKSYAPDVSSGTTADILNATSAATGVGCVATGQTTPMTFSARCYTSRVLNALYFKGTSGLAVPNSPSAILIGATNPNLTAPGLCGTLLTDALISIAATANASGSFTMADVLAPYSPTWQGAVLYTQAVTTDLGQPGIPLALSGGVAYTVPAMQPPGVGQVVRIFETTSATALVGTVNFYAYGIIVRFTH